MESKYPVFRFRLSSDLKSKLKLFAEQKGITASRLIKDLLTKEINENVIN